jgi:hypothetical protein
VTSSCTATGAKIEEERRGLAGLLREPADGALSEIAHGLWIVALGRIEAELAGNGSELRGTQAEDAVVFDEDAGDVVVILRDCELVIETELERAGFQFFRVVDARFDAVAEMPFADEAGGVAVLLQQRGDGRAGGLDEEWVEGVGDATVIERRAPAVAAGDEGVARGRADGGGRVGVRETPALAREAIEIRCADECRIGAVGTEAAVAVVVGEDDDDVG